MGRTEWCMQNIHWVYQGDTQDLYRYVTENPTFEESRQNVKELAEKFLVDLKRDQKELADKEFKAQEEINELGGSNEGQ